MLLLKYPSLYFPIFILATLVSLSTNAEKKDIAIYSSGQIHILDFGSGSIFEFPPSNPPNFDMLNQPGIVFYDGYHKIRWKYSYKNSRSSASNRTFIKNGKIISFDTDQDGNIVAREHENEKGTVKNTIPISHNLAISNKLHFFSAENGFWIYAALEESEIAHLLKISDDLKIESQITLPSFGNFDYFLYDDSSENSGNSPAFFAFRTKMEEIKNGEQLFTTSVRTFFVNRNQNIDWTEVSRIEMPNSAAYKILSFKQFCGLIGKDRLTCLNISWDKNHEKQSASIKKFYHNLYPPEPYRGVDECNLDQGKNLADYFLSINFQQGFVKLQMSDYSYYMKDTAGSYIDKDDCKQIQVTKNEELLRYSSFYGSYLFLGDFDGLYHFRKRDSLIIQVSTKEGWAGQYEISDPRKN